MEKTAFRLGASTFASVPDEATIEQYAKAGIAAMEISVREGAEDEIRWDALRRAAEQHGVELWSFHLPFSEEISIANPDKALREKTIALHAGLIAKAADAGVKTVILHPSSEPIAESARGDAIKTAQESLGKIAQIAAGAGTTVAVENLPRTCLGRTSAEMLELLCADERLKSCLDTNHLLTQPLSEYIREVGSRLITLHVSDYDFGNERHWLPGEGKICWQGLIDTLKSVHYSGPFLYEVRLTVSDSIRRRALGYEDLAQNYAALMRGQTPQPIGVPVPEKCPHWLERQQAAEFPHL